MYMCSRSKKKENPLESSAVCISEMLLHVSNGAYIESICLSERFLVHVEALFAGIDKIHSIYLEYNQTGKKIYIWMEKKKKIFKMHL